MEWFKRNILHRFYKINVTQKIVASFVLIILIGSILLSMEIATKSGVKVPYVDALFTATSATCVTGLVVYDTYTHWSMFGQTVILVMIQIGGLGFMTIATLLSLAIGRRISLRERMAIAESLNQLNLEGIVRLTKKIIIGTFMFEGAGAIILAVKFSFKYGILQGIYKGVFHSVSAFCNAGFDLMGQDAPFSSLTGYTEDSIVNIVIISLIIIGGLGYSVWDDIYTKKKFKDFRTHSKIVITFSTILILATFIYIFIIEFANPETLGQLSIKGKIFASLFQSVTPRTAGFNTIDLNGLKNASVFVTMILMFIGGSPGSTAGGVKTTTIAILILSAISAIKGSQDVEAFKKRINVSTLFKALSIVLIGIIIVAFAASVLFINEDITFKEGIFEAVSAFGTVGLSLGITPSLTIWSKLAIIITMFSGRVGVLTIAIAFSLRMINKKANIRYPEENVMVG